MSSCDSDCSSECPSFVGYQTGDEFDDMVDAFHLTKAAPDTSSETASVAMYACYDVFEQMPAPLNVASESWQSDGSGIQSAGEQFDQAELNYWAGLWSMLNLSVSESGASQTGTELTAGSAPIYEESFVPHGLAMQDMSYAAWTEPSFTTSLSEAPQHAEWTSHGCSKVSTWQASSSLREDSQEKHGIPHAAVPRSRSYNRSTKTRGCDVATLMVHNIPNQYSLKMLVDELWHLGFQGLFDYLYLPVDSMNRSNVGYFFINFTDPRNAERFTQCMEGYMFSEQPRWFGKRSVWVSDANVQGLEKNVAEFRARCVGVAEYDVQKVQTGPVVFSWKC